METALFQLSPFVQKQFQQFPELNELLELDDFNLKEDWVEYQKNNSHLDIFAFTRKYRKSRLALIAARDDINKTDSYLKTLQLTSQLAYLIVQYVYNFCKIEFFHKYGEVIDSEGTPQEFIIYALGKLGGNELNYSSDIDLVFCYSGNGTSNGEKQIDAFRYFERLGRRLIQILDNITQDGFVYRVDMRLRPFGNSAPLVCSTDHLLSYLQNEGRDWERYAWLRASFIAGNKSLGSETLKAIQPFIYRKYLDYGVFESLRQIKEQIIRKQLNDPDNIKLGTGGIREIEFIVQTLQLTFAGRNKQLQGNDLWDKMQLLNQLKHLSNNELTQLSEAWLFLRKLENLSQIIDDRPSHHLLSEHPLMSVCMGCSDMNELMKRWNQHRQSVHKIFLALFITNSNLSENPKGNPKIQSLKDQISQHNYPKSTKHKLYSAMDALSVLLINDSDINTDEVITRYYQVLKATSKRSSYLSMLIESPYILKKLIYLLNISCYFSETISKHPMLLELLFEDINENDYEFNKQWQQFQKKHKITDSEDFIEILNQFKQRMQFLIVTAYKQQNLKPNQTCQHLSELAELILCLTIHQAWNDTIEKIESDIHVQQLIIIAYGSLAMKSMNLDSDFDIVFVLDGEITDNNHRFIMRWVKRIIHLLTTQSYSGYLYKLDTQLRPNGNSGAAIVSAKNFESYQLNQAWVWEQAALVKTRTVYATQKQQRWFNQVREKALCRPRQPDYVHAQLNEMALKLEQQNNKNHQKEFKELAEILIHAYEAPELIARYQNTPDPIRFIKLDHSIIG